jgi:hypothetical protein
VIVILAFRVSVRLGAWNAPLPSRRGTEGRKGNVRGDRPRLERSGKREAKRRPAAEGRLGDDLPARGGGASLAPGTCALRVGGRQGIGLSASLRGLDRHLNCGPCSIKPGKARYAFPASYRR